MKQRICLLIICLSLSASGCRQAAKAKDSGYVWPIEKTRKLSSTFAEHRDFRFHSGIDIPTQQKTGYKVFACQSGYVYRLFASWSGYGKAVYLKLDDGRFAVYGHLSDFSKEISDLVVGKQVEARRYKADFFLPVDEIRVDEGKLIGYSGETGWGGPHLHFELRDSTGNPINPLTSGFSVKDGVPPRITYLAIRPLALGAKVNGSEKPETVTPTFDPHKKVYTLDENPVVEGEIGLELCAHDRMETSPFSVGIYGAELYLDDSLLFSSRYDEISFPSTHKVELDHDFELRGKRGMTFHKLFIEEGNDLLIYDPAGGRINTEAARPGPHQLEIRAFDAAGNESTLRFFLIFDQSPVILSCCFEEKKDKQWIAVEFQDLDDQIEQIFVDKSGLNNILWQSFARERISSSHGEHVFPLTERLEEPGLLRIRITDSYGASSGYKYLCVNSGKIRTPGQEDSLEMSLKYDFTNNFFVLAAQFNQIFGEMPRFWLRSGGFTFDPLLCGQPDEKSYHLVFPFFLTQQKEMSLLVEGVNLFGEKVDLVKNIPVAIITKSFGGEASSSDGLAKVEFKPNAVYQDMNVTVRIAKMTVEPKHKLVGRIYSFEPSAVPLNGWARISLAYSEAGSDPQRLGLYELEGEESWSFVGQELDTLNCMLQGQVRHLSAFALLEDTLPPRVSQVSISPGKKIKEKRPKITAKIVDDLSGIGSDEDVRVEIDGEWMIPEYDPEKYMLSTRPIYPLTSGKHLLTIWVKDRAGNENRIEREFFVVGK